MARFMNGKAECAVQLRQSRKEYDGPVPGIHFKVKKDLKIIQNCIFYIVRFVNDDNRCFSFIEGAAVDRILYDLEVVHFPECGLGTKRGSKTSIEVINGNR